MYNYRRYLSALLACLVVNGCGEQAGPQPPAPAATVPGYRAEVFNVKMMDGLLDPVSRAFLLVGRQGSILRSGDGYDWEYADTPVHSQLNAIAGDAQSGILVAVGQQGALLRSTDGGRVWQQARIEAIAGAELARIELKTVIHNPANDVWVAAGTRNAILRSTDQGASWRLVSYDSSDRQLEILALFVEAGTKDFLLAAQRGVMGRSRDGADWKITYHDIGVTADGHMPHLVDFYQHGETLIAAGDEGRLLVSRDGGANWELAKLPTSGYFTGSAYDPVNRSIVLITQEGDDIFYSTDEGRNWELVRLQVANWPGDEIPMLSAIVYDPKTRALLAMGSSGIVARSTNGGKRWQSNLLRPLFNLSLTTLLHDPQRDLFIASGLGGFIAASRGLLPDPSVGWRMVRPGIDDMYMREVIHLPGTDTFVIVGQLGGIWRSEDDGRNWSFIEPRYPFPNQPPHLRDVIIEPSTGALVAAGPDGSIMRSTDGGRNWVPAFQGVITLGEAFTQILTDRSRNRLIVCEVMYRTVYLSDDGGAAWYKAATVPSGDRNLWYGAVSGKLGLVMVVGQQGAIGISDDGGVSWEVPQTGIGQDLYGAFADERSGALFAVGDGGVILRSEDGKSWHKQTTPTRSTLRRMYMEPSSGALLAFGQDGVILRSEDAGRSWLKAAVPAAFDGELRKALTEPGSGNTVIVGREGAILLSADGGLSWGRVPSHTDHHFRSAAFNPATGTLIAVGEVLVRLSRERQ